MLAYWPESVVKHISSQTVLGMMAATERLYSVFSQAMLPSGATEKEIQIFTWSLQMAISRHVIYNEALVRKNPPENFKLFMCPVADLLNHSFEPNATLDLEKDITERRLYFTVRSLRSINKDEQVTINYGPLSNLVLAQRYGFVVEGANPHNSVPLAFESEKFTPLMLDAAQAKMQIMRRGLLLSERQANTAELYHDRIESDLIAKMRVWMLTNREIETRGVEEMVRTNFRQKFSDGNERLAYSFLKTMLSNRREALGNKDYAKEKRGLDRFGDIQGFNLYNAYVLEEEERQILDNTLKYIAKHSPSA